MLYQWKRDTQNMRKGGTKRMNAWDARTQDLLRLGIIELIEPMESKPEPALETKPMPVEELEAAPEFVTAPKKRGRKRKASDHE